jgi:LysR family transcriptional regulator, transcriptional activator of nhaA
MHSKAFPNRLPGMTLLNFHYLRYFWAVAREGGLRRAAERMHVSQPTISAQVKALEEQLGQKLTRRDGRGLALTDAGRRVFEYANEIMTLGEDLVQAMGKPDDTRPMRVTIGVTDSLPKLVSHALMRPLFELGRPVQVVVREASAAELIVQLAAHRLDLVLADEPAPSSLHLRTFNHRLGECGVSFCAVPALASRLRRRFPRSLGGEPMLLPTHGTALRRSLDHWFELGELHPRVVAEYDDGALMKIAAADGLGVLPIPVVAEREAVERFGLVRVGRADECRQEFFAISTERALTHPAVVAITTAARESLFAGAGRRAATPARGGPRARAGTPRA